MIGIDLLKEFSMFALADSSVRCLNYKRIHNVPWNLFRFVSQTDGTFRVTFELTRNWYWLLDYILPSA